jgi:hypothetical protein
MTNIELTDRAEKEGFIIEISEGIYAFAPKMVKLINEIKETLINGIAKELDFEEWIFPRIIPEKKLKATGWLKHHPNEAFIIHSLPNSKMLDDRYLLDPIQCISLYAMLFEKKVEGFNEMKIPIKIYETQGGWTFRNEDKLDGLFKAKSFLRVEFVYMASFQQTIDIRNTILEKSINLLNAKFNLNLTKAKGDSCFIESPPPEPANSYAYIGDSVGPLTPAIDVVFKRGDEYLELASGTIAHDHITNNFKINSDSTKELSSGCFGFGLNRIALVILESKNFNLT